MTAYPSLEKENSSQPVPVIEDTSFGYPLPSPLPGLDLWWCESGWKVGQDRPAPKGEPVSPVSLETARGEYEAVQIILRPQQPGLILNRVVTKDLTSKKGRIPSSQISLFEVATVKVENPSDVLGKPGEYPDPLPPLKTPFELPKERNQAFWISLSTPSSIPGGEYQGELIFETNQGSFQVPLRVTVFNFALPKKTHLRSGFGLDAGLIKRYHHLQTPEQEAKVWEMYMQTFATHRIAPYAFYHLASPKVQFEGEGPNKRVKVDFKDFDRAGKRYLDKMGFNAFMFPLQGMGGGTFYSRHPGEFGGYQAGTPEYDRLFGEYLRQIEAHLKEKKWLDKAYIYWFDEPEPRDYPFVIEGMQRLKRFAPGLHRLLTEQPEKELYGHVDIWCGLTPEWTREKVEERRKAGEEVWWYICTVPKAPYIGLFIEHPAVEMRLWPWQSWQYGVQGILVWQTNYWTSPTAFPNSLQNPWEDPMSYVAGYGTPPGTKRFWGNGDGRFLYPPRRDPNVPHPPILEPPISSIRLENLRDGIEDYEYFVLLKEEIDRLRGKIPPSLLKQAEDLLVIPPTLSQDLTHFTKDVRLLLNHRRQVARMIEHLRRIRSSSRSRETKEKS